MEDLHVRCFLSHILLCETFCCELEMTLLPVSNRCVWLLSTEELQHTILLGIFTSIAGISSGQSPFRGVPNTWFRFNNIGWGHQYIITIAAWFVSRGCGNACNKATMTVTPLVDRARPGYNIYKAFVINK